MTASRQVAAAAAVALAGLLAAGCASTSPAPVVSASRSASVPPVSAATSLPYGGQTWATVPMGGTGPNLFWQLFALPDGSAKWQLRTPPGIATNGAIVLAGTGSAASGAAAPELVAGVRPSLDLDFSPLITTADAGRTWSALPPVPGLANVPDALAAAPGGHLIALSAGQAVTTLAPSAAKATGKVAAGSAGQATLTTERALAQAPGAASCQLTALTAVGSGPAGTPLLGGACARPGVAGIFSYAGGTWRLAGPVLPATLGGQDVRVLRLTTAGHTVTALLQAGAGTSASLVAASATAGQQAGATMTWSLSPALRLHGSTVQSASFDGSGQQVAVVLSSGHGAILAGPHATWQALPALPPGRAVVLALPAGGGVQALAASGGTLTAWQLPGDSLRGAAAGHWVKAQVIKVPIQYGSSSSS